MKFSDLAATSAAVSAVSGRKAKIELLADALRRLDPDELAAGSAYLAGELRQRQTGVGYASLRDQLPQLTVLGGCCGTDHRHVEAIGRASARAASVHA